jgi:hypothetical protein
MAIETIGLIDPVLQFVDAAGVPYASGTVTFYATGTQTLQNIYSDRSLSTPLPNPLPLNASGRSSTSTTGTTSPVYFSLTIYDYVLKDANGVTIYGPITFSGSQWPSSGLGTAGYVLTSNGATTTPTFQASPTVRQPTYTAKTANYTAVSGDLVAATANSFNVTLPLAASNAKAVIWVVNNGTGTTTILPSGSDTVGLTTSQQLNPASTQPNQGDEMTFISDGISNWVIS